MKKSLILFLLLNAFGLEISAQLDCEAAAVYKVTAPSGLRIRSAPNTDGKMIASAPLNSELNGCQKSFGKFATSEAEGDWRKVEFKGKTGYIWDGFLEVISKEKDTISIDNLDTDSTEVSAPEKSSKPENPNKFTNATKFQFVTEAYNFCGDVGAIDPGLLWYGFYPKDDRDAAGDYRIRPVNLKVVLSAEKVGSGMEFDIESGEVERSVFLIGMNRPLDAKQLEIKDKSELLRLTGRKVFPGQELIISENDLSLKLTASGTVEAGEPCPTVKNYKLLLKGKDFTQNLTESLAEKGECGMPEVYWFGDFTGDGIPEIVLVSVYKNSNYFSLFISKKEGDKISLEKESEFVIEQCY